MFVQARKSNSTPYCSCDEQFSTGELVDVNEHSLCCPEPRECNLTNLSTNARTTSEGICLHCLSILPVECILIQLSAGPVSNDVILFMMKTCSTVTSIMIWAPVVLSEVSRVFETRYLTIVSNVNLIIERDLKIAYF